MGWCVAIPIWAIIAYAAVDDWNNRLLCFAIVAGASTLLARYRTRKNVP
jgi:hypothetical protein